MELVCYSWAQVGFRLFSITLGMYLFLHSFPSSPILFSLLGNTQAARWACTLTVGASPLLLLFLWLIIPFSHLFPLDIFSFPATLHNSSAPLFFLFSHKFLNTCLDGKKGKINNVVLSSYLSVRSTLKNHYSLIQGVCLVKRAIRIGFYFEQHELTFKNNTVCMIL